MEMVYFDNNRNLVYYIYNKYFHNVNRFKEDLLQCGSLGLWKACLTYNEDKGILFSSYATRCIKNEMCMFMRAEAKHKRIYSFEDIVAYSKVKVLDTIADDNAELDIEQQCSRSLLKDKVTHKDIIEDILNGKSKRQIAIANNISRKKLDSILRVEGNGIMQSFS